jgi:hypothetical protein
MQNPHDPRKDAASWQAYFAKNHPTLGYYRAYDQSHAALLEAQKAGAISEQLAFVGQKPGGTPSEWRGLKVCETPGDGSCLLHAAVQQGPQHFNDDKTLRDAAIALVNEVTWIPPHTTQN